MGSPKRTVDTTTQQGTTASSGTESGFVRNGMTGPAAGQLDDFLARAAQLSQGNYVAGPSELQQQAFGAAPGMFQQGMTGLNTLQGLASGNTQNAALDDSIRRQMQLNEGSYLNGVLGSSGGLTNSGARQDLSRLQNNYVADRLSNEHQFNINTQANAANAMPGYIQGLLNPLSQLGGQQQALNQAQLASPINSLGILGNALQLGGARYGTESETGGTFNNTGETSSINTQPGATKPSMMGSLLGLAGTLGGAYLGSPAGGAAVGNALGSLFGGGGSPSTYGQGGMGASGMMAPQVYNPAAARGGMLVGGMPW